MCVSCSSKKKCNTRLTVAFEKKILCGSYSRSPWLSNPCARTSPVIFEIDLYGTLDWVNVAEVECGVIWTKHGTYTMLTPNTLYHTNSKHSLLSITLNFSLRGSRGGVTRRQPRKKKKNKKFKYSCGNNLKTQHSKHKLEKNASVTKIFICSS